MLMSAHLHLRRLRKPHPQPSQKIYGDDKPEAKAPQPQAQERQPAPTEAPQADTGQTDDSGDSDIRSFMNERNMVRTYPDAILSGHPTIPLRNSEVVRRTQRGGLIPSDFPLVRDAQNAAEIVQMDIPDNERTWSDEIAMGLTILGQRSLRAWQELTDSGKDRADLLVPAQTEGAISEFVANDLLRFSGLACRWSCDALRCTRSRICSPRRRLRLCRALLAELDKHFQCR